MELLNKQYKAIDTVKLPFSISPRLICMQIFLTIVQAIIPTALIALATARFVDTAIKILNNNRQLEDIYIPLVLLLVVAGFNSLINTISKLVISRIDFDLERKLKPEFIRIRANLNYEHIENSKSWEIISRVADNPVAALQNGVIAYLTLLRNITSIISILGLIVVHVWWAAIMILVFSIPLFWISLRSGKKNYMALVDTQKYVRRHEYYGDVLINRDAVEERTLFRYGESLQKRFADQYEIARKKKFMVAIRQWVVIKGASMAISLIALLIALTLINPVIAGQLSSGMFMGIVAAVFGLVNRLGWSLQSATEKISQANEYMKDLTVFVGLSRTENALDLPDSTLAKFNSLEFRNVRFKYPTGERHILNGLSFKIEAGKHYAFVGENGAGKTTITKLLTGLYTDYDGEILINGKELRSLRASTIKALFSILYQDFVRYQISLADNIAIGDITRDSSLTHLSEIAKHAGIDELIKQLKEGINTHIGRIAENSVDVSGGQWQRIAIARSIASPAPIKILDEPTAALDPISESLIYQEFNKLMQGKTTILISHRLGSAKLADEIFVFKDGALVEQGSHEELVLREGLYADMFEMQRSWYE